MVKQHVLEKECNLTGKKGLGIRQVSFLTFVEIREKKMTEKFLKEATEWIKSLAIAGVLALVIHTFLFAVVIVSGPSMEPTLHNNERLIMNKVVYHFHQPERGDVIVFHATAEDDYIKRVIGLPGEKIDFQGNQLFINGKPVSEPYLTDTHTNDFGPMIVPKNKIFVMGDNRINSTDSRVLGPISLDKVVGRVKLLIWPLNKFNVIH